MCRVLVCKNDHVRWLLPPVHGLIKCARSALASPLEHFFTLCCKLVDRGTHALRSPPAHAPFQGPDGLDGTATESPVAAAERRGLVGEPGLRPSSERRASSSSIWLEADCAEGECGVIDA